MHSSQGEHVIFKRCVLNLKLLVSADLKILIFESFIFPHKCHSLWSKSMSCIINLCGKKIEPSATASLFAHEVLLQLASIKLTPETLQPVWKGVALLLTNQPHANCALLGSPGTKCVKVCTCSMQAVWKWVALMQPRVSTCVLNAV